ncbi:MAG: hypothetical protein IJR14_12140 [Synergistaceae bacterium]|nr:hypothetical protein [Synergistaceae bacterium]
MMGGASIEERAQEKDLPVGLIRLFLENQRKELELRAQELEIAKQEEQHSYDVTKLSLRTQADDLEKDRAYRGGLWRACMKFATGIFAIFALLTALALWLGKEQFMLEIMRAVFYGGSGAAVGAYYQKAKRSSGTGDEGV